MLTPQCFLKFCLLARTSEGDVLRDFVFVLIRGVKALGAAIQRGEVELRRTGDNHTGDDDSRPLKRLKACESQKGLTAMLKAQGVTGGAVYARINGETNKAVTGLYKGELAKELGLRGSQVNARDYMTKAQLAALELVEVCSAEALNTTGANDDPWRCIRRYSRLRSLRSCESASCTASARPSCVSRTPALRRWQQLPIPRLSPRPLPYLRRQRMHPNVSSKAGTQSITTLVNKGKSGACSLYH